MSRWTRKWIEEVFGRGKEIGLIRKTKFRGKERIGFQLLLTQAGYNMIRLRDILAVSPSGQEGCL